MLQAGRIDAAEHQRASAELERILAGPRPEADEEEPPEEEAPEPTVEADAPAQDQG
jgi:monofunctional biosynthetic peptidoglycan transglycosylase